MTKIALCVPAYDGRVHDEHATSVALTMQLAGSMGIQIMPIYARGCAVLPDVRNWLVAQALMAGCDKVWFVDSDIAWGKCVKEALNMLLAPADIVAAVHQRKNGMWNGEGGLVVGWGEMPPPHDEATGCLVVDKVATAFVSIDRSVFEKLADAGIARNYLPSNVRVEDKHYPYLRNYFWYDFVPSALTPEKLIHLHSIGYDGPMECIQGEDFYFCRKAKEVGCKVLVDPRVSLIHFDGCVKHDLSLANVKFEAIENAQAA